MHIYKGPFLLHGLYRPQIVTLYSMAYLNLASGHLTIVVNLEPHMYAYRDNKLQLQLIPTRYLLPVLHLNNYLWNHSALYPS